MGGISHGGGLVESVVGRDESLMGSHGGLAERSGCVFVGAGGGGLEGVLVLGPWEPLPPSLVGFCVEV
jgi:hypothetical protein